MLVANKTSTRDAKHIYAELKAKGLDTRKMNLTVHLTVHNPRCTCVMLEDGDSSKPKRIEAKPGVSFSPQMHRHLSERWVIVNGAGKFINGEREILTNTNEFTFTNTGYKHCLTNLAVVPCVMIEAQSRGYIGEDDIERSEDAHGRVTKVA
jgi:mannose-1-phosphate guanylyltransferase